MNYCSVVNWVSAPKHQHIQRKINWKMLFLHRKVKTRIKHISRVANAQCTAHTLSSHWFCINDINTLIMKYKYIVLNRLSNYDRISGCFWECFPRGGLSEFSIIVSNRLAMQERIFDDVLLSPTRPCSTKSNAGLCRSEFSTIFPIKFWRKLPILVCHSVDRVWNWPSTIWPSCDLVNRIPALVD